MAFRRAGWQPWLRQAKAAGTPLHGRCIVSAATSAAPIVANDATVAAAASSPRRARLRAARPFSDFLTDKFERQHDYLRISLTERCNLRCLYCMPEEGVELSPTRELLTTPEIVLLADTFVGEGVRKIRLTGGEPTVRRDFVPLMQQLGRLRRRGLRDLCLTTNGVALHRKLEALVEAGLTGVNLSLDTLDAQQFLRVTRRDGFTAVKRSMDRILALNAAGAGVRLKINCVVMRGLNEDELGAFVALTRDNDLEVRFIEYMPFDGNRWSTRKMVSFTEMLERIGQQFPTLRRIEPDGHHNGINDTSKTYEVPGFAGRVGFITSMTHNFCSGCNRLRITSDGSLKVCLFGNAEVSLRDILRRANDGEPIDEAALADMVRRAAAETSSATEGTPSGILPNTAELLDVIGMAVKRKKAQHAGLGELEHMKNRPMILIDPRRTRPQRTSGIGLISSWDTISGHLLPPKSISSPQGFRIYSTCGDGDSKTTGAPAGLTHVTTSGTAHMVSVSGKAVTMRTATAVCKVQFSSSAAASLVRANEMAKGDVLGVARVAGIMAAKRTADLIPLCHPLALTHVRVTLDVQDGTEPESVAFPYACVAIRATVQCEGKTGVEMEALTAASVSALTVYDMCKAVDKGMRVDGLQVVLKEGGKSGHWEAKDERERQRDGRLPEEAHN